MRLRTVVLLINPVVLFLGIWLPLPGSDGARSCGNKVPEFFGGALIRLRERRLLQSRWLGRSICGGTVKILTHFPTASIGPSSGTATRQAASRPGGASIPTCFL